MIGQSIEFRVRGITLTLAAVAVLLAFAPGCRKQYPPGILEPGHPVGLKLMAMVAKRDGKTHVEVFVHVPIDNNVEPADESSKRDSYLVAVLTGLNRNQTITSSYIFTTHRFKVERLLQTRPPAAACDAAASRPGDLPLDEFNLSLLGGTAVIDGVTITQTSPDDLISLSQGSRYLLIGSLCADGRFALPHVGALDVYGIETDGRIIEHSSPDFPLYPAIVNFRTIDALASFLSNKGSR